MTLEQSLYAAPPEKFVAARDEAVARARADGDRDRAKQLAGLRRPTVAAWLVNLLALRRPEQVGELLDLGAALREAQQDLRGEQLRELSAQRRAAISGLVAQARRLAVEAGRPARDSLPLAEVEATLSAALADDEVAEAVRAGRLTRAAGYAGFGEAPRPQLRVVDGGRRARQPDGQDAESAGPADDGQPPAAGRRAGRGRDGTGGAPAADPGSADRAGREQARRDREREADRARREAARLARIEQAQATLGQATADEREAVRVLAELSAELERLRERHAAAEIAVREAKLRRRTAERDANRAGRPG